MGLETIFRRRSKCTRNPDFPHKATIIIGFAESGRKDGFSVSVSLCYSVMLGTSYPLKQASPKRKKNRRRLLGNFHCAKAGAGMER